jgi:hypothetical protein
MVAALPRVLTAKGGMCISTLRGFRFLAIILLEYHTPSIRIDTARRVPQTFRQTSTQMYPYIGCTPSALEAAAYPLSSRFSRHFVGPTQRRLTVGFVPRQGVAKV